MLSNTSNIELKIISIDFDWMRFCFGETLSTCFFHWIYIARDDNSCFTERLDYFTYLIHNNWHENYKWMENGAVLLLLLFLFNKNSKHHRAQSSIIILSNFNQKNRQCICTQTHSFSFHQELSDVLEKWLNLSWKTHIHTRTTTQWIKLGVWMWYCCRANAVNICSNLQCKLCTDKIQQMKLIRTFSLWLNAWINSHHT